MSLDPTPNVEYRHRTRPNSKLCGAKNRQGNPCRRLAMKNGRCDFHGGKSLAGAALPQFIHGRQSKFLPSRLASYYAEAQSDHDLISVRDELRLIDAMVNEALSRLDTKEAEAHWAMLDGLLEQADHPDQAKRQQALNALKAWSKAALTDFAVKSELLDLLERRRKLAETETKRQAAMGQMITATQAVVLMAQLVDICRRHVTDRNQLSAISRDIATLAEREPE